LWALYVLAGLALLVAAVLSVPVDLSVKAEIHSKLRFGLALRWFFGLINVNITPREKREKKAKKEVETERRRRKKGPGFGTFLRVLRIRGLLGSVINLIKDAFKQLRYRDIEADFTIGTGDPADTGMLFAFIGPAITCLRPSLPAEIIVRPVADSALIEGYFHGTLRLRPIRFVPPLARFFFSVPVFRAAKTLVAAGWRSRKRA
jgi:hypothetical protein